ncbi:hypothetical protein [Pengzhenrongella phosphoraccumulans]|uniref:hypothetical protein n=1 Tax=Pengzhenrongella phosphoraccumulans TaxID=3114394 RepID=UPI00388DEAEF
MQRAPGPTTRAVPAARSAEYDAFGPWIDEIRDPADVPRLYRDHPLDLANLRLVLKVPRNVARRDATPDMDLYDHLLAVGPASMTVLSRQGDGYSERRVAFDDIAAISDSVNLLDGRLVVHTLSGPAVTVGYNGASRQVVARLVRVLRELSMEPVAARPPGTRQSLGADVPALELRDLGDRDVALVTLSREVLRSEPGLRVLAAHGRIVRIPRGGAATRALHLARPMTLQGAIVCGDADLRLILGRRQWLVRGNRTEHSLSQLTVPLARFEAATVRDHPRYLGVRVVTLRAGEARLDVPVPTGSAAEEVLLA